MPIKFTVEVVYQPVDGIPRKDTVELGLGDYYAMDCNTPDFCLGLSS